MMFDVALLLFGVASSAIAELSPGEVPANVALDILRGRVGAFSAGEIGNISSTVVPGVSYPNFITRLPEEFAFTCAQVHQPGYYADIELHCQVYHRCEIGLPLYSYLCPEGKLFNQVILNCDWWYNVQCDKSGQFYDYSNPRLYLGPNVTFLNNAPDNATSEPKRAVQIINANTFTVRPTVRPNVRLTDRLTDRLTVPPVNNAGGPFSRSIDAASSLPSQTVWNPQVASDSLVAPESPSTYALQRPRFTQSGGYQASASENQQQSPQNPDHRKVLANLFSSKEVHRLPGSRGSSIPIYTQPPSSPSFQPTSPSFQPTSPSFQPQVYTVTYRNLEQTQQGLPQPQSNFWSETTTRPTTTTHRTVTVTPFMLRQSAGATVPIRPATVRTRQTVPPMTSNFLPSSSQPKLADYDDGAETLMPKTATQTFQTLAMTATPIATVENGRGADSTFPEQSIESRFRALQGVGGMPTEDQQTRSWRPWAGPLPDGPQFMDRRSNQFNWQQPTPSTAYASSYQVPQTAQALSSPSQEVPSNAPVWQSDEALRTDMEQPNPWGSASDDQWQMNLNMETSTQPRPIMPTATPVSTSSVWMTLPSNDLPSVWNSRQQIPSQDRSQQLRVTTSTPTASPLDGQFNVFSGGRITQPSLNRDWSSTTQTTEDRDPGATSSENMQFIPSLGQQQDDGALPQQDGGAFPQQKLQFAHSNSANDAWLVADGYGQDDGTSTS